MSGYEPSDEHQPITWLNGYPLYAAHFIVLVYVVSLFASVLMSRLHFDAPLDLLVFDSGAVLRGEVWRVFTYGLLNQPSLWFVVDMFMIAVFGRELEKFFGRKKFLWLYAGLYLLSPVIMLAVSWRFPTRFAGETGAFSLFIAFATLYPNAVMMFNILAKWMAAIFVGLYTLIALSNNDNIGLLSLWLTTGFAFAYVRYEQGHFSLPRLRWPRRKPKLRVLPDLPTSKSAEAAGRTSMAEVDALLDKIARSGIGSLTPAERARLDAARADLLKRESRR